MIRVDDLIISFDGERVINGVTFHVPQGSTHVLLGKNGSGKSVILKAVAGINPDYEGKIEIAGNDVRAYTRSRSGENSGDSRLPGLAYVFQKGGLFDSMSVYDNVAFGLRRMGMAEDEIAEKVASSLNRVGLAGNEEKLPSELSGGMQKRVGLARAVCMEPAIILFDDPTAGLDPVLSDSIADLLLEIRESLNTTALVVTHDLKVAEKVADDISLLYQGRLAVNEPKERFFSRENDYARQFIEGDIDGPIDMF